MDREFLVTNGLGGYISSMSHSGNTRKYHGLLVASLLDMQRMNVLNRLDEFINYGDEKIPLSTNYYQGNVCYPDGKNYISNFLSSTYPTWWYSYKGMQIKKSLVCVRKRNAIQIKYEITSDHAGSLVLTPLITYREIHSLLHFDKNQPVYYQQVSDADKLMIMLAPEATLKISLAGFSYHEAPDIYSNFFYPVEQARGYDASEDLQKVGDLNFNFQAGSSMIIFEADFVQSDDRSAVPIIDHFAEYVLQTVAEDSQPAVDVHDELHDFAEILTKQAEQFVVNSSGSTGIIAGYHWFGEWGRDTFIAFKGLLLDTGKVDAALGLLTRWGKLFKNGLLPNQPLFNDYHSLDAVLWYAVAIWEYYLVTHDAQTVQKIIPRLEETVAIFEQGVNGVKVDERGFLIDQSGGAMTWMDAKVDGSPVIDRTGAAVEIQALWYNFLKILQQLKLTLDDQTHIVHLAAETTKIKRNFESYFWNEKADALFDSLKTGTNDETIRPNQVIVGILPFELLGRRKLIRMLETIEAKLLTPVGLLTLPKDDPHYHGLYDGPQRIRDEAYHQGTIWPFLLGMYLNAYLVAHNQSKSAKNYVRSKLLLCWQQLQEKELQYVPELFEADTLLPRGCISQAWSVGCILDSLSKLF